MQRCYHILHKISNKFFFSKGINFIYIPLKLMTLFPANLHLCYNNLNNLFNKSFLQTFHLSLINPYLTYKHCKK